ncbi:MAG: IBR domain-containing protein [bacterium]
MKKMAAVIFVLFGTFSLLQAQSWGQVQARSATVANYAEMGLALASIPADIAAHVQDGKKNKKTSLILHLAYDALSILNKFFSIYNDIKMQERDGNVAGASKEFSVNGVIMLCDLIQLGQHAKQFLQIKDEPQESLEILDAQTEKEISALASTWNTVGLTSFKGVTAFALAWCQSNNSGAKARAVCAVAHALTRLLDAYAQMDPRSSYRNFVLVAILANAAWLIFELTNQELELESKKLQKKRAQKKELKAGEPGFCGYCWNYKNNVIIGVDGVCYCSDCRARDSFLLQPELPARNNWPQVAPVRSEAGLVKPAVGQDGQVNNQPIKCPICMEEKNEDDMFVLGCEDHFCRDCMQGHLKVRYEDHGTDFDRVVCLNPNCAHHYVIGRDEIQAINNDPKYLERYDNAAREHQQAEMGKKLGAENIDLSMFGGSIKSCPKCGNGVEKDGGCDHMTCKCRHEFCWRCLGDRRSYSGHTCYQTAPLLRNSTTARYLNQNSTPVLNFR